MNGHNINDSCEQCSGFGNYVIHDKDLHAVSDEQSDESLADQLRKKYIK